MTQTARVYGGSLYDLAAEEKKTEEIREQMAGIRQIVRNSARAETGKEESGKPLQG